MMLIELAKIPTNGLKIDQTISYDKSYYQDSEIQELRNVQVKGIISYDYVGNLNINLDVFGIMVLLDAITLESLDHEFNFKIDENLDDSELKQQEYYEKTQNSLDIMELLWQNIILEVPIRIVSNENQNTKMTGDGWQLNNKQENEIDPRLAPLLELLDEGKE